ncbi:hypothetical protein L596_017468 [Steinernema carpocapsae]|uniref:Uncharacterized protein n=1 Tax=Steinernema carpocapsae TaxID=34508 RepID=A0A4U5N223_STECR|nr:hypothetical protein L596_017468 [Steinernema carpocapsae]
MCPIEMSSTAAAVASSSSTLIIKRFRTTTRTHWSVNEKKRRSNSELGDEGNCGLLHGGCLNSWNMRCLESASIEMYGRRGEQSR